MKMKIQILTQRVQRPMLAIFLLLPFMVAAADKRDDANSHATVKIKNFGKVNDHIYRGGQPEGDNYRQLVALGVKTIVDLRSDSESSAKATAENAGLRYVNLPLAPKGYPEAEAAERFLAVVNEQENGPFYVHCAGGRHRTGAMLAVYRMEVDKWDIERTYQEMKDFDFYTRFGHGCYKDYVYDYSRSLQARTQPKPVTNTRTIVTASQQQ
jgi:tyrosine-protein phosphatase SIW14